MLEAVQEHWLGSFLFNILGYLLILLPAALLIRYWKNSPLVKKGKNSLFVIPLLYRFSKPRNVQLLQHVFCCSCAGQGPLYSLLHMLVFGDDRTEDPLEKAEAGEVAVETKPPSPKEEPEMSTVQYCSKLVVCVIGLQASYLTWGVLQVRTCSGVLHEVVCLARDCAKLNYSNSTAPLWVEWRVVCSKEPLSDGWCSVQTLAHCLPPSPPLPYTS